MKRRRPAKPGERLKVRGKLIEVPGVASLTAAAPEVGSEKPDESADELPDDLKRVVKAAYQ